VKGKTGARDVVARTHEVRGYLKRLLALRKEELIKQTAKGEEPKTISNNDFVFCDRDGKEIGSLKKSFDSLLKFTGLEYDEHGSKRTIYSLRHTYATFRLNQGVHQFALAKNMGTSVAMLERHYGHTSNLGSVAELTKGGRSKGGEKATVGVGWLEDKF
jgi:integrase